MTSVAGWMARLGLLAFLAPVFVACNFAGDTDGLHWFMGMHDSHAVEAQEEDYTTLNDLKGDDWQYGMSSMPSFGGPGSGMRVPPEGSVPRGQEPYPYAAGEFDAAGRELQNPLPRTREILARGQDRFNIYCAVCHGYTGHGDGPVTPRFANVPSLMSAKIKNWRDGEIFHIITMGRGRMTPYAAQTSVNDRWSMIHYLRVLQQQEATD